MKTGERFEDSELSTVDTAHPARRRAVLPVVLRRRATRGSRDPRARGRASTAASTGSWAQPRRPAISLGWSPEEGFLDYDWRGYNEAMLVYLLALGSPTLPGRPRRVGRMDQHLRQALGARCSARSYLDFPPLFGHQYTHVWIDFRDIQDAYMRRRGLDYFENSRRAIYAQQAYAMANPRRLQGLRRRPSGGITASDGPGRPRASRTPAGAAQFRSYAARGIDSPARPTTARWRRPRPSRRSPFAPELVDPGRARHAAALRPAHLRRSTASSMPSIRASSSTSRSRTRPLRSRASAGSADDYLGIDQGPIVAMIENYRSAPGLARDAQEPAPAARPGARRLHGWLARACVSERVAPALADRRLVLGAALLCAAGCRARVRRPTSCRILGHGPRGRGRRRS